MAALAQESDSALIARVLKGETEAFGELVGRYEKKIYNLCLRMSRNQADAEDLTQESFLKAYRALRSFRQDSSFYVWLYRIASNLCIDFIRRERLRNESALVRLDQDGEEEGPLELPDLRALPEAEAERKELRAAIQAGLDALRPQQRQILVMRDVSGLSYEEIAQVLHLEKGTVKSRINRARGALAKLLAESGNLFEAFPSKQKDGR